MNLLKELSSKDIGTNAIDGEIQYKLRKAARAIVVGKDKRIAILCVTKDNYHKLPGGGLEDNESIKEALAREVMEEVGANIETSCDIGCIIEYRDEIKQLQISYCYMAKVVGDLGIVNFTQDEINDGFELKWYTIQQAIDIMKKDQPKSYIGKFINKRDLVFLKEAYKLNII